MSPVAMPDTSSSSPFTPLFEALRTAPTAPGMWVAVSLSQSLTMMTTLDAKGAADRLAREVSKQGLQTLKYVRNHYKPMNGAKGLTVIMTFSRLCTLSQPIKNLDMNGNLLPLRSSLLSVFLALQ